MQVKRLNGETALRERRVDAASVAPPVRVVTVGSDRRGTLLDLSTTGAEVEIEGPPSAGATVLLKWASDERLCTVIWTRGNICGLSFEPSGAKFPLPQRSDPPSGKTFSASLSRIVQGRKRRRFGEYRPSGAENNFLWQVTIQVHRQRGLIENGEAMSLEEQMFFFGAPLSHVAEYQARGLAAHRSNRP